MFTLDEKHHPSDEWIVRLRQRFPVERTVDEALTWKLQTRRGPEYRPLPTEQIAARLAGFLRSQTGDEVTISDLKRLPGGASKEQFTFTLEWREHGQGRRELLILRMNPGESISESHRQREFEVLRAVEGSVPVPQVYWVDADGASFGRPALICGFVRGVVKPVGVHSHVSGVGVDFGPALRPKLAAAFTTALCQIHAFSWQQAHLPSLDVPRAGTTEAALWQLNWWRRVWEEDSLEEHPAMTLAYQWLQANLPVAERITLVHGDYRSGNFLFDQETATITAVLDWELAHLGDYHEDLGWIMIRCCGHFDEQGQFLVCGMKPKEEFLAAYERASGLAVHRRIVDYYEIFNAYRLAVMCGATDVRAARDRQTHLDPMMNFLSGVGYMAIKELHRLLTGKAW